jgi:hypothetical protein
LKRPAPGEKDGGIVGQSLVHGFAGVVADKEGVSPEIILELLVGIRHHSQGPYLQKLGIEEGLGMGPDELDESADQTLGLAATCPDEDPVAGVDAAEDDVLCGELVRILLRDLLDPGIQFFRGHWFSTLHCNYNIRRTGERCRS